VNVSRKGFGDERMGGGREFTLERIYWEIFSAPQVTEILSVMNKPNFGSPELLCWDLRGVCVGVSQATKLSQATHDPSAAAFVTHKQQRRDLQ